MVEWHHRLNGHECEQTQVDIEFEQTQVDSFWAPESLQMVITAMKLKDAYSLEGKLCPT